MGISIIFEWMGVIKGMKKILLLFIVLVMSGCSFDESQILQKETMLKISDSNKLQEVEDTIDDKTNEVIEDITSESQKNETSVFDDEQIVDSVEVKILNQAFLYIDEDRFVDGRLDNRLELSEIDSIFSQIQGEWEVGKYVGFIPENMYYGNLFGIENSRLINPDEEIIMYQQLYKDKVEFAKNNKLSYFFTVNNRQGFDNLTTNMIYTYGKYESPTSISISLDKTSEYYPIYSNQIGISSDLFIEYPNIYIKFFLVNENEKELEYIPATIVIPHSGELYILIDGAFYELINK